MAELEQCKDQRDMCAKMMEKDIDRIMDRFNATDKALAIQQIELERRMTEGNHIKHEFGSKIAELKMQVSNIETKTALWWKVSVVGLSIFQIVVGIILRISLK